MKHTLMNHNQLIKSNIIKFVEVEGMSIVDALERAHGLVDNDGSPRYERTDFDLEVVAKLKSGNDISTKANVISEGLSYLGLHHKTLNRMCHGLALDDAITLNDRILIETMKRPDVEASKAFFSSAFEAELSFLLEAFNDNRLVENIVTALHQKLHVGSHLDAESRLVHFLQKHSNAPHMVDWAIADVSSGRMQMGMHPELGAKFLVSRILEREGAHRSFWVSDVQFVEDENYAATISSNLSISLSIPSEARVCDVVADGAAILKMIQDASTALFKDDLKIDSWLELASILDTLQGNKKKSFAKAKRRLSLNEHLADRAIGRLRNTEGFHHLKLIANPCFIDKARSERLMSLLSKCNRFAKTRDSKFSLSSKDKERFYEMKRVVLDAICKSGFKFDELLYVKRDNTVLISRDDFVSRLRKSKALYENYMSSIVPRRDMCSTVKEFVAEFSVFEGNSYLTPDCDTSKFKMFFFKFCEKFAKEHGFHSVPYLLVALAGDVRRMQELFIQSDLNPVHRGSYKWGQKVVMKAFTKRFNEKYFDVVEFTTGGLTLHVPAILFNTEYLSFDGEREDLAARTYGDTPSVEELESYGSFNSLLLEVTELLKH